MRTRSLIGLEESDNDAAYPQLRGVARSVFGVAGLDKSCFVAALDVDARSGVVYRHIPSGFLGLTLHLDDGLTLSTGALSSRSMALTPIRTGYRDVRMAGAGRVVLFLMHPVLAIKLLREPLENGAADKLPAAALIEPSFAQAVRSRLRPDRSLNDTVLAASCLLENALTRRTPVTPARQRLSRFLCYVFDDPAISLDEAANKAGVGRRQLRRDLDQHLGISPKHFSMVCRVSRALVALQSGDGAAGAAVSSGFFDQAHMAGTVKAMTGLTARNAARRGARLVIPGRSAPIAL